MESLITVETNDSDVNCPYCQKSMPKLTSPLGRWPERLPIGVSVVTRYLGLAFCKDCRKGPYSWCYQT